MIYEEMDLIGARFDGNSIDDEGQNGLNWERWQRIVRAAEDLGFVGLYRSDHFTNPQSPDLDALEILGFIDLAG